MITEFLLHYIGKPMQWGVDDCSLIVADWWRENHGSDPAAHLRGTYSTEAEKVAIVDAAGGLLPLVRGLAGRVSALPMGEPRDGDFAVLGLGKELQVCGIRSGGFWAVRSETGIAFTSAARVLRGWSV